MSDETIPIEELLAHREWLRRLCRGLISGEDRAEDVCQETLAVAVARPPATDRGLRGWLATVARNAARRRGRRDRAEERRALLGGPAGLAASTADAAERVELERLVARLVLDLDEPYRSTLLLRYFDGLEPAEIARRSGEPGATVRSRIRRGLTLLRGRLDRRFDDDRRSWQLALTPLAGGALVTTKTKTLAASAALLLLGGAVALGVAVWPRGPKAPPPPAPAVAAATEVHQTGADATPSEPPATAPVPVEPSAAAEAVDRPATDARIEDRKGSLSMNGVNLKEAFRAVEKEYGVRFDVAEELLPDLEQGHMSIGFQDAELGKVVALLLAMAGFRADVTYHSSGVVTVDPLPASVPVDPRWPAVAAPDTAPPVVTPPDGYDLAVIVPENVARSAVRVEVVAGGGWWIRVPGRAPVARRTPYGLWAALAATDAFEDRDPDTGASRTPAIVRADATATWGEVFAVIRALSRPGVEAPDVLLATGERDGRETGYPLPLPIWTDGMTTGRERMPVVRIARSGPAAHPEPMDLRAGLAACAKAASPDGPGAVGILVSESIPFPTFLSALNEARRFGLAVVPLAARGTDEGDDVVSYRFAPLADFDGPTGAEGKAFAGDPSRPPRPDARLALSGESPPVVGYRRFGQLGSDRYGARNLRENGGSARTENAVGRALDRLVATQREDGAWAAAKGGEADVAATALAVLALGGRQRREDREALAAGLEWLVSRQDEDGGFGDVDLRTLSLAVAALADSQSGFREPKSGAAAEKVARALEARLEAPPAADADPAPRLEALVALATARALALPVRDDLLERGRAWIHSLGSAAPRELAALARMWLGEEPGGCAAIRDALEPGMATFPPRPATRDDWLRLRHGVRAWREVGGDPWLVVAARLRDTLPAMQRPDGSFAAPADGFPGGETGVTAWAALTLESFYRNRRLATVR